jgi:serine/threonine-protein phosphatase 2A activator
MKNKKADATMASRSKVDHSSLPSLRNLEKLDWKRPHQFIRPVKRINEGHDVPRFLSSRAYSDISTFIMQLNMAMCPKMVGTDTANQVKTWPLDSSDVIVTGAVKNVQSLLSEIDAIIEEAPPDTGPRRFGNVSFRTWYGILEAHVPHLLQEHLSSSILSLGSDEATAQDELSSYLLGGFGSAQRLDYGTGHELSFLAFLGCIWKLGGFEQEDAGDGSLERSIVLGIIEP